MGPWAPLPDHIEAYIKQMLRENQGRAIEPAGAQLTDVLPAFSAQINYVLATRFSLERGYIVGKQGGGRGLHPHWSGGGGRCEAGSPRAWFAG